MEEKGTITIGRKASAAATAKLAGELASGMQDLEERYEKAVEAHNKPKPIKEFKPTKLYREGAKPTKPYRELAEIWEPPTKEQLVKMTIDELGQYIANYLGRPVFCSVEKVGKIEYSDIKIGNKIGQALIEIVVQWCKANDRRMLLTSNVKDWYGVLENYLEISIL